MNRILQGSNLALKTKKGPQVYVFFYLGFLSRTFIIHRTPGEEEGYLFNSSPPLPLASQTVRHQRGDYCVKLSPVHSQQADSNQQRKSTATQLHDRERKRKRYIDVRNFLKGISLMFETTGGFHSKFQKMPAVFGNTHSFALILYTQPIII